MKYLFFLFLLFACHSLHAQDLLVTQQGDSLNCKINKVSKDRIYFTYLDQQEVKTTVMYKSQVKLFQHNYYSQGVLPDGATAGSTDGFPRIRLGLSGGLSYRTASTADNLAPVLEEYLDNLKKGYNFNLDAAYYFSPQSGAGIRYNSFHTSNSISNVTFTMADGTTATGTMSDDITITYVGPYFSSRMLNNNQLNALVLNVGLGYIGYQDNALLLERIGITGSTLGFSADIGYDMSIAKKLSLGVQLSMVSGVLKEYEMVSGGRRQTVKLTSDSYENLARFDLSIGLRFIH